MTLTFALDRNEVNFEAINVGSGQPSTISENDKALADVLIVSIEPLIV
jgi:hypothetical protein